jgi:peptidoglycan/xylan/chitin deacetylase (PgdA/CDA1 family)
MIVNLCFHGVGTCAVEREPGEARYWVQRDAFLRMLDVVAGTDDVRLSFDDGNRSDVETALPALAERGLRATFFVLAGRLEDPASVNPSDLVALKAAGMKIGSHGWRHVPFRRLRAEDARREFVEARGVLERASGGRIEDLALPLGRYDRASLSGLRQEGYRAVYTSDRFHVPESRWLQARFSLTAEDTAESLSDVLHRRHPMREAAGRVKSVVKSWL